MQLHIYHALLDEPMPWDVRVIHGRVTADNITRAVRESFYSGGYLWDEKFDAFIKHGATITMLMCWKLAMTSTLLRLVTGRMP